jgi:predicted phage-related endonuclease
VPELVDVTPGSPEWLDTRRAGVTATDIPVILGISSYESAYSLYYRKRGELPEVEDNDRIAGAEFMLRLTEPGKYPPPSLDGSVATLAAVRARLIPAPGKQAPVSQVLMRQLADCRREAKEAESNARLIESEIRERAGEATVYTDADGKVIGRRVIVNGEDRVEVAD